MEGTFLTVPPQFAQLYTVHVLIHGRHIDFKQSMMGVLDQVYPVVPQKSCLFHLSKNVYKRVQDEGMPQLCMTDEEFRTNIRMISALSSVPIAVTIRVFDALSNHVGNQEQVILDYFESNYIVELRRATRLAPRFPHAMWNMSLRVQNKLPRTNSDLEGWHNRFAGSFQQ